MKFLRSVVDEMKKVTWPTGKQLRRDTLIVIETSLIFALFFYIVDALISTGFGFILK